MVTIKDVARRANVAPGTVSNVLTGNQPVAEATRARVLEAVAALGYQPNVLARSLVNRRSETLAVVVSGLEYYGPSRTLVGIDQAAEEHGYSLMLSLLHHPQDPAPRAALAASSAHQVDGILWAVPEIADNRAWITPETLAGLPPILFLSMAPRPGVHVVAINNRHGARLATEHLLAGGRRRIGLVAGPTAWWEARERTAGWRDALADAGRDPCPDLVATGDWYSAGGERATCELLARCPDIDALFVANDQMALGALRCAHQSGRRVPDDIAVVGFDNQPESGSFWPPLTTVYQRMIELGKCAVNQLHEVISARRAGQEASGAPLLLQPELIVRQSTSNHVPVRPAES